MLVTKTFCVAISMTILNRFQPFLDGDGGRNLVQCAITASVESMSVPATCCVQFLSLSAAFTHTTGRRKAHTVKIEQDRSIFLEYRSHCCISCEALSQRMK